MSLIEVKCVDQALTITSSPLIASGDVGADRIRFEFCPLWDDFTKTAIFYRSRDETYSVLMEKNECTVPKEVLSDEGAFFFGVFGVNGSVVKTSEVVRYKVRKGALTEDLRVPDPTPDIYAQILARIDELGVELSTYITNEEIDRIIEM
ncbi:MAG: hypothetical protein ACI4NM_00910 [Bullifex sp.]